MSFFCDKTENGGIALSRSELCRRVEELYCKIDEENEKKEELALALSRAERTIRRLQSLVCDMEAELR